MLTIMRNIEETNNDQNRNPKKQNRNVKETVIETTMTHKKGKQ